jgi:hypothetical protein
MFSKRSQGYWSFFNKTKRGEHQQLQTTHKETLRTKFYCNEKDLSRIGTDWTLKSLDKGQNSTVNRMAWYFQLGVAITAKLCLRSTNLG